MLESSRPVLLLDWVELRGGDQGQSLVFSGIRARTSVCVAILDSGGFRLRGIYFPRSFFNLFKENG